MDEESHWNNIAETYEEEIFDVFKSDKNKRLPHYFNKYANPKHTAVDLGCGIGKAIPYLAPAFKKVLAVDISDKCLDIADNTAYQNIEFRKVDLTDPDLQLPPADFGFCCNVLLLPDLEKNIAMIRNAYRTLKNNGAAVFVMPALDSIFLYAWRLIEWHKKEGLAAAEIPDDEFSYFSGSKRDLLQGLINIDGVTTKHYSHSELEVIFHDAGFNIEKIDKVVYDWTTEFISPPKWLKDPYPWDWLVEVSK